MDRPTPFDLVFSSLAHEQFPAVEAALASGGVDPRDRDAFLLTLPVMQLLRELRPADADAGAGVDELTALLHHAYLAWAAGLRGWTIPDAALRGLLARHGAPVSPPPEAGYIQVPERVVWAALQSPGPWEPMDGCFVHATPGGEWRVLGVFGLHAARAGFTVAEAVGRPGVHSARRDGTPLFVPSLEGGALAGLHALVEPEELVELAGRVLADAATVPFSAEVA